MEVREVRYTPERGWSDSPLPAMDSPSTLVLLFGAPEYIDNPAAIEELARAYPSSHLIGCSTSGEIWGTRLHDHSLSVGIIRFERTRVRSATAPVLSRARSYEAGAAIARDLDRPDLRAVFVLSDGQLVNGSELIKGLNSVLPETIVVTGGLAGDGDRFERTWVLIDGKPTPGYVSAVGLYGEDVQVWHGSNGGWDLFGPERRVTRADGNILYELDGKPALQLYKTYLGERARELPAAALLFPLALRLEKGDEKSVVRTILAIDEENQAMIFAGDIPEGSLVRFMKANFERLIEGAAYAAERAREGQGDEEPLLAIAISCVGRRLVLGERTEEELEATLRTLPPAARQIGFYSYGEIAPYSVGRCDLHNQTMTMTTIAERA